MSDSGREPAFTGHSVWIKTNSPTEPPKSILSKKPPGASTAVKRPYYPTSTAAISGPVSPSDSFSTATSNPLDTSSDSRLETTFEPSGRIIQFDATNATLAVVPEHGSMPDLTSKAEKRRERSANNTSTAANIHRSDSYRESGRHVIEESSMLLENGQSLHADSVSSSASAKTKHWWSRPPPKNRARRANECEMCGKKLKPGKKVIENANLNICPTCTALVDRAQNSGQTQAQSDERSSLLDVPSGSNQGSTKMPSIIPDGINDSMSSLTGDATTYNIAHNNTGLPFNPSTVSLVSTQHQPPNLPTNPLQNSQQNLAEVSTLVASATTESLRQMGLYKGQIADPQHRPSFSQSLMSVHSACTGTSGLTGNKPLCRICQNPGEPGNPLISPCRCAGTMQHVHRECLVHWLEISTRKMCTSPKCELCSYQYRTHHCFRCQQVHVPKCSSRDRILHVVSAVMLLVMIGCLSLIIIFLQLGNRHNTRKMDLGGEEITAIACALLFFLAFFIIIITQYRAEVSICSLCFRCWLINKHWRIKNYVAEGETKANHRTTTY